MHGDRSELAFLEIHLKKNTADRENIGVKGGYTLQAMVNLMLFSDSSAML